MHGVQTFYKSTEKQSPLYPGIKKQVQPIALWNLPNK